MIQDYLDKKREEFKSALSQFDFPVTAENVSQFSGYDIQFFHFLEFESNKLLEKQVDEIKNNKNFYFDLDNESDFFDALSERLINNLAINKSGIIKLNNNYIDICTSAIINPISTIVSYLFVDSYEIDKIIALERLKLFNNSWFYKEFKYEISDLIANSNIVRKSNFVIGLNQIYYNYLSKLNSGDFLILIKSITGDFTFDGKVDTNILTELLEISYLNIIKSKFELKFGQQSSISIQEFSSFLVADSNVSFDTYSEEITEIDEIINTPIETDSFDISDFANIENVIEEDNFAEISIESIIESERNIENIEVKNEEVSLPEDSKVDDVLIDDIDLSVIISEDFSQSEEEGIINVEDGYLDESVEEILNGDSNQEFEIMLQNTIEKELNEQIELTDDKEFEYLENKLSEISLNGKNPEENITYFENISENIGSLVHKIENTKIIEEYIPLNQFPMEINLETIISVDSISKEIVEFYKSL